MQNIFKRSSRRNPGSPPASDPGIVGWAMASDRFSQFNDEIDRASSGQALSGLGPTGLVKLNRTEEVPVYPVKATLLT